MPITRPPSETEIRRESTTPLLKKQTQQTACVAFVQSAAREYRQIGTTLMRHKSMATQRNAWAAIPMTIGIASARQGIEKNVPYAATATPAASTSKMRGAEREGLKGGRPALPI